MRGLECSHLCASCSYNLTLHADRCAVGICRLKRYARGESCNKVTALGVELHIHALLSLLHRTLNLVLGCDAVHSHHLALGVVAHNLWQVKHREHTRENGVVAKVNHIAGVGSHLIEARVEWQMHQREVTVATTINNRQGVLLKYDTLGVEQLHIECFAQIGGLVLVGGYHIALKPYLIALIVACVVEMDIYLLLRK